MYMNSKVDKTCILLCITIGLMGCSSSKEIVEKSTGPAEWLVVEENLEEKGKNASKIQFLDKELKEIKTDKIVTRSDTTYKYVDRKNKLYYKFGPGGLIRIDMEKQTAEHIIKDKDINIVSTWADKTYYYHNIGYVEDDLGGYKSKVCEMGDDSTCINLKYSVADLIAFDHKLYILGDKEKEYSIKIYENMKMIKEIPVTDAGNLYIYEDTLYYMTKSGMMDINTQKFYKFIDTNHNPKETESTYRAISQLNSTLYIIDDDMEAYTTRLYKVKKTDTAFILEDMKLGSNTILDYETNEKNLFTFLDRDSQFYTYDVTKREMNKLNIKVDHLSSYVIPLS